MLPIVEEIRLDTSNVIHIGQSVNGTYAVTVSWCTGTAGGGSTHRYGMNPFPTTRKRYAREYIGWKGITLMRNATP